MRWSYVGVLLIYLTLAFGELHLHWYMGHANTSLSNRWRDAYLSRDPHNHKRYVQGYIDYVAPTIVLGIAVGFVARKWKDFESLWCIALVSIGIFVLWPVYENLARDDSPFWFGAITGNKILLVVFEFPRVLILFIFFFFFGRFLSNNNMDDEQM